LSWKSRTNDRPMRIEEEEEEEEIYLAQTQQIKSYSLQYN